MTLNEKENAIYKKLATKDLTFKELLKFFSKSNDISISKPVLWANLLKLEKKDLIEKTGKNPRDKRSHKWHVINSDEVIAKHAKPFVLYRFLLKSIFEIRQNYDSPQEVIEKIEQLLGKLTLYCMISYEHDRNLKIFNQTISHLNEFFNSPAYYGISSDIRSLYDLINNDNYLKEFTSIIKILNCPEINVSIDKIYIDIEKYFKIKEDVEIEEEDVEIEEINDNANILYNFKKYLEYDLSLYRDFLMSEGDKDEHIKNLFALYEKLGFPAYDNFRQRANEIEDEVKNSTEYRELLLRKEKRKNEIQNLANCSD